MEIPHGNARQHIRTIYISSLYQKPNIYGLENLLLKKAFTWHLGQTWMLHEGHNGAWDFFLRKYIHLPNTKGLEQNTKRKNGQPLLYTEYYMSKTVSHAYQPEIPMSTQGPTARGVIYVNGWYMWYRFQHHFHHITYFNHTPIMFCEGVWYRTCNIG